MSNSGLNKNKTILMVSHNLNPEGASWSLFFLAKGLKKIGYDIKLISSQNGSLRYFYEKEGISVIIFNFVENKIQDKYLKNVDIFFVNTIIGFKFFKTLNLDANNIIWCIRESEKDVYFKNYPDLKKEFFKNVKKVVFVSNETQKIYEGLNSGNFRVIHNGLDIEKVDSFIKINPRGELRKKYSFSDENIVISIIGTVCLRKGQLEFVEAALKFLKEGVSRKVNFIIVGGKGDDYEKRIRELISDSAYKNNFSIIKETPGAYEYFRLSDIFVCNSYIESFPRVILEAMAFGLPIIATNVYGIPEQIVDERDGLLISAGDVSDLASKIKIIIGDKKKAEYLARNARKRVEEEFNYETMINKYDNLFKEICAE